PRPLRRRAAGSLPAGCAASAAAAAVPGSSSTSYVPPQGVEEADHGDLDGYAVILPVTSGVRLLLPEVSREGQRVASTSRIAASVAGMPSRAAAWRIAISSSARSP